MPRPNKISQLRLEPKCDVYTEIPLIKNLKEGVANNHGRIYAQTNLFKYQF